MIISSRETAFKVKNLRRDPWPELCAFTDRFFGRWIYVEGDTEVVSLPEAMDLLIDYYKRFPGENPDWDDYRARMEREKRVLIRIATSAPVPTDRARSFARAPMQAPPGASLPSNAPVAQPDRAAAF